MYVIGKDPRAHARIVVHDSLRFFRIRRKDPEACNVRIISYGAHNAKLAFGTQLEVSATMFPNDVSKIGMILDRTQT